MVFTCGKCEVRSTKTFSRQAYEKGVVLVSERAQFHGLYSPQKEAD